MKRKHPKPVNTIAKSARKILRFLISKKETLSPLLILTHDYPDPDALASAFALQYLAQDVFGISSRIVYGGIIGRMENRAMVQILKIPVYKLRPKDLKKYENVVLVDTQPAFENNAFPGNRKATLVIDQHESSEKPFAEMSVINTECAATSVLLAECLLLMKVPIPFNIATALAYGILSDTLNLYRTNQLEVIQIYLEMISRSNLKALAHIQNPLRSRPFFATLSRGIHNAKSGRGLIISHLGFVHSPELVSQVADFLLTYRGISWVLVTGRCKHRLYASLRSVRLNVQAGEILRDVFEHRGQAGGHGPIAGGNFRVSVSTKEKIWREAERNFVERLLKRLRIPVKSDFYYPFRKNTAPKKVQEIIP